MASPQLLYTSKATGPDEVHPAIIKLLADILGEALARLFNTSLDERKLSGAG